MRRGAIRRVVRSALLLVAILVSSALAASAAHGSGAAAAVKPLRIAAPAAGRYSVKAFALTARKRPRLRLLNRGALPKSLIVAGGIAPDKKRKGRYYAFVIQINRKTTARTATTARRREATFVVVDPESADIARTIGLRDAILQSNQSLSQDTIVFLANPPGTPSAGTLLNDVFSGNDADLAALAGGPGPPSTQLFCTLRNQRDPVSTANELNIFTTCNEPVIRAFFTFPAGTTVTAFLPMSCNASGSTLACPSLSVAAGSPFEVDARFAGSVPGSMPFTELVTAQSGQTTTLAGTGPP